MRRPDYLVERLKTVFLFDIGFLCLVARLIGLVQDFVRERYCFVVDNIAVNSSAGRARRPSNGSSSTWVEIRSYYSGVLNCSVG